jgi:hypothetical protein
MSSAGSEPSHPASTVPEPAIWKEDWPAARRAFADWWAGKGLAPFVTAPAEKPREDWPWPDEPPDLETRWLSPAYRAASQLAYLSRTFHGGVALPIFNANIGPGSLGLLLGCEGRLAETTVWYEPTLHDPDNHPPLRFDPANPWFQIHMALIEEALRHAEGRYLVGIPDLIENLDTLAQLRGPEQTLLDILERPEWMVERIQEINQAFFEAFDAIAACTRDFWGGTSFHAFMIWGLGRTAKLQCDFSCMISPAQFRRLVFPALQEQIRWLDHALYHLDGTQALPQLPNLLDLEGLHAIEWTPQAGLPGGGSPEWYGLYRQIKRAGKAVQAIGVAPEEVEPLLDAVGPEGMFVMTSTPTEEEARRLLERVGWRAD